MTAPLCNLDGSIDITGCKLSIYPMSDQFVDIITTAINQLNQQTLPVWSMTDLFSTTYRGNQQNVINVVKAATQLSYRDNVHEVFELTFSKGCPGDVDADRYLNAEIVDVVDSKQVQNFDVHCKYSFYAFGDNDYMDEIGTIVDMAKEQGLNPTSMHYATELTGTVDQLFNYFNDALAYAHDHIRHYVLEATISVNSPSLK